MAADFPMTLKNIDMAANFPLTLKNINIKYLQS